MYLSQAIRQRLLQLSPLTFLYSVISVAAALFLTILAAVAPSVYLFFLRIPILAPFLLVPSGSFSFRFLYEITVRVLFLHYFESELYRDNAAAAVFVFTWQSAALYTIFKLLGFEAHAVALGVPLSYALVYAVVRVRPQRTITFLGLFEIAICYGATLYFAIDGFVEGFGPTLISGTAALVVGHVFVHARYGDPDDRWAWVWGGGGNWIVESLREPLAAMELWLREALYADVSQVKQ